MRISAKLNYALRALIELGMTGSDQNYVRVGDIAKRQKIPKKYLVQILIQLKKEKIVESIRGREGGYYLIKPLNTIKLGDIITIFEGGAFSVSEISRDKQVVSQRCLNTIWDDLGATIESYIRKINLQEIVDKVSKENKNYMFHI